jgi:hypothetical protein
VWLGREEVLLLRCCLCVPECAGVKGGGLVVGLQEREGEGLGLDPACQDGFERRQLVLEVVVHVFGFSFGLGE